MSTAQMFTRERIIPQLVSWFNALPDNQRIIRPTDVPFFNIKVIRDPNEPTASAVVVGDQSLAVNPIDVLGEATFTWAGRRHQTLPRTAIDEDFYEVAKNVALLNLQETGGAALVGTSDGETVQAALNDHTTAITALENGAINFTSAWDGPAPLKLGAYYLWVDAAAKLRMKSSLPTSDTDGTIIGTQIA